jgi:hypothetical protein
MDDCHFALSHWREKEADTDWRPSLFGKRNAAKANSICLVLCELHSCAADSTASLAIFSTSAEILCICRASVSWFPLSCRTIKF